MDNSDLSKEIVNVCAGFAALINTVDSDYSAVRAGLTDVNREQEDLLHELELSPLSACERSLVANKLIEVRHRRRQLDNDFKMLQLIIDHNKKHPDWLVASYKLSRDVRASLKGLESRTYTPRIRKDIKLYQGDLEDETA